MWIIEKPTYLLLLLVLPLLAGLLLYTLYWKRKKQAEFGNTDLIKRLSPGISKTKTIIKIVLLLAGTTCLILAIANPQIGTRTETVKRQGIDIVFAVDVSTSMLSEDVAPSRLEKSRQIVSQIINQLGTDRVGIIGYAGSAYPVLPITSDFAMAKMYLQGMNTTMVSSQGTAIEEAIKLSLNFYDNPTASKILVLISDGEDHGKEAGKAAQDALEKGLKIITVGVGTEEGGPIPLKEDGITRQYKRDQEGKTVITKLDSEQLKIIADITSGEYVYGGNTKQAASRIKEIMSRIQKTEYEAKNIAGFEPKYQWLAFAAFVLVYLEIFLAEQKSTWFKRLKFFKKNK